MVKLDNRMSIVVGAAATVVAVAATGAAFAAKKRQVKKTIAKRKVASHRRWNSR